jgi:hypothetical protein
MVKRLLIHKNIKGIEIYTHQLFIWENEDLRLKLEECKLYGNRDQINTIIKNSSNNKIGYYQFQLDKTNYFKIYIIPKTVTETKPDKLLIVFNNYLTEYQRLKRKYNQKGVFTLEEHIDDFNINLKANKIEDSLIENYIKCINEILSFFKRHNKEDFYTEKYCAQSITDRLDLKSNVLEINKSYIHQKRDLIKNKSILAHITNHCLIFFINKRLPLLRSDDLNLKLKITGKALQRLIKLKFTQNHSKFSIHNLINIRTYKYFKVNSDTKRLYRNLLLLVGNKDLNNNYKIDDLVTIYFSPEYMYELVVKEYLEEIEAKTNYKLYPFPVKKYSLKQENILLCNLQSNPDFILKNNKNIYIIDAKWKVLSDFSSIKVEDVLKLNRDAKVHDEDNLYSNKLLIYPQINITKEEYDNKELNYDYNEEVTFKIKEVQLKL